MVFLQFLSIDSFLLFLLLSDRHRVAILFNFLWGPRPSILTTITYDLILIETSDEPSHLSTGKKLIEHPISPLVKDNLVIV